MGYEKEDDACVYIRRSKREILYQFILLCRGDDPTPFFSLIHFCQTEYYNDDYIRGDMKLLLHLFRVWKEGCIYQ